MLLSICVPTYNRKRFLEALIRNVIGETKGLSGTVELCISDNGSTDGTEAMARKYAARHRFITYRRNRANIGYDRNLVKSISMARGEYVWLMGDDDTFERGAIKRVLDALRDRPPYLIAAFRKAGETPKAPDEQSTVILPGSAGWLRLAGDIWITSYMGSHIVRRNKLLPLRSRMANGNGFAHVVMFFNVRRGCDRIVLLREPCIVQESEGVTPSSEKIASIFFGRLPTLIAALRKERLLTDREYDAAMHSIRAHILSHLLPAMTVAFKDFADLEKGRRIALASYKQYFLGTEDDTLFAKTYMLIARSKAAYYPFALGAKIFFEIFYVRLLNPFRRAKISSPWSSRRNAARTGAREQVC